MDYSKLSKEWLMLCVMPRGNTDWNWMLKAGLILISCYPLYMSVKNGRK